MKTTRSGVSEKANASESRRYAVAKTTREKLGLALIAIALIALPFVLASAGTAWVRITNFAVLFVLLSLGLNIVVGYAGLLDLGYVAFYAVGAYVYALLASPHFGLHLPFWVILPIGAAVACVAGVILGAPTLRLRGDYLAIVTLGFGEIVRIFMNNLSAPVNLTNGPKGINRIDSFQIGPVNFSSTDTLAGLAFSGPIKYYYFLLLVLLAVIVINRRLQDSRIGRAWVAIREDEVAAKASGINTRNIKLLAFAMGASFGGIAGGMFAAMQTFVSPESFVLNESIMVLAMVVLGGLGNSWGVIAGASANMTADHDVFQRGHVAEEADVLEGSRDAGGGDAVRTLQSQRHAGEQHLAAIARVEPGEHVEQRRLAGAVGTDQAVDFPGLDGQRNILQRLHAAEALANVAGFEQNVRHRETSWPQRPQRSQRKTPLAFLCALCG